jgi:hypothetical protein
MNKNRAYFAKILLASIDPISCDISKSQEYIAGQNISPESIKEEGIKRIRRLQLQARAAKTSSEMVANDNAKKEAAEWVEKVLSDASFSFASFVREENMILQNRSIESFTIEDIKTTLTKYMFLKILGQGNSPHV